MSQPGSVVIDASVLVDLLAGTTNAPAAAARLAHATMHAPAHIDAEVASALGRLHRAGELSATDVSTALLSLNTVPLTREPVHHLLLGAWTRRDNIRLVDALYVELAARLQVRLLTSDQRLARACPWADIIGESA